MKSPTERKRRSSLFLAHQRVIAFYSRIQSIKLMYFCLFNVLLAAQVEDDSSPTFDLSSLKQKEIVIINIMKEERSLDVELEFGLKIYISFVICVVFGVGGIILIFFSFGVGDLFKTNDRHVNVYGISFAALCFLPMCVWLYVVLCPNREVYYSYSSSCSIHCKLVS